MRYLIVAAIVALALARPHPRPRNDVSRAWAKEKRAEISEGMKGAASLHSIAKKPHASKGHAKPADPEAAEKEREKAEREAKAVEESKQKTEELQKELEKKRLDKEKLAKDMKLMHKAMTETTTTTTAAPIIDSHILDVPDEPKAKAEPAPATPAEMAKMAEEKNEKVEHAREAEEAAKREEAKAQKAQAEAKKLKEQEKRLHSEVQDLKAATGRSADSTTDKVKKDEETAAKIMKEVGNVSKEIVPVSAPASIAPPEKKADVPKVVQQADEEAKRVLLTKTHERSKAARKKTEQEIESEARRNAASLHAAVMDADAKKVEADLKKQKDEMEVVKNAERAAQKEDLKEAQEAKKNVLKPKHLQMFKPHTTKFNPEAPEEVAKRAVEEVGRREGALQGKMEDMMGNMEKIRAEISH